MWRRPLLRLGGGLLGAALLPTSQFSCAGRDDELLGHPRRLVHDLLEGEGKLIQAAFPGIDPQRARKKFQNMILLAGTSVPSLADEVAYELSTKMGGIHVSRFADGEVGVQVMDNVRGRDVYIIQSTSQPVNENLMELLLTISALRRASAANITAVVPYYGYLRDVGTVSTLTHQLRAEVKERLDAEVVHNAAVPHHSNSSSSSGSGGSSASGHRDFNSTRSSDVADSSANSPRRRGGAEEQQHLGADSSTGSGSPPGSSFPPLFDAPPPLPQEDWGRLSAYPVSAADIAKMLEAAGCDRVISVDLQPPGSGQIEGFFTLPVENLRATPICVEHLSKLRLARPVVVAPNEACIQLAHDVAAGLQARTGGTYVGLAMTVEAGPSRGTDRYVHRGPPVVPGVPDKTEEPPIDLVGDVGGCDVVIVDEMIDTAGTLMRRVKLLKDRGARRVVAFATHGLFNGAALARITRSPLSEVIVTNTVPLRDDVDVRHTHKIVQLSVAPVLAEAILRVQTEMSLQPLRAPGFKAGQAGGGGDSRYKGQE